MRRFDRGGFALCLCFCVSACGGSDDPSQAALEGLVCGADGQTYSVEEAAKGDREVAHRGRCDTPMPCDSEADCFVGDVCGPPDVSDDGVAAEDPDPRSCIPGPTRCNCPGVFEPVCGTDGRSYINRCEAACAAVAVRQVGLCEEPSGTGCVRAGCSDHLCVAEGAPVMSTCEWRDVYACYQQAACERQENGQCGFTPTHELVECLQRHGPGPCEIDPRWVDGFTAECEAEQFPGIVGIVAVTPEGPPWLAEPFFASFELLEPPLIDGAFSGEAELFCDGERVGMRGHVAMTPLGDLSFTCRALEARPTGECRSDRDCPPGHFCEDSGRCVDSCALIDCPPGHFCEEGQCLPQCPSEDFVATPDGRCEPKCYGPEQCPEGLTCNAAEVCLQDPACPACDVCVGWCTSAKRECRPTGCNGEICADRDVASPCVALPEFACYQEHGICERQPWACDWARTPKLDMCLAEFDCRGTGCEEGSYCTFCWTDYACIPEGAVC